jgi:hypothetical protein
MSIAKGLMLIGGALVALGLLLQVAPELPVLGKLPGDIRIERESGTLYFPVVTCLLLSAIVTLVMQLIERMK